MFVSRRWRYPKAIYALFILEGATTIAALALFGIADPNLYRTKLWADGAANGFNSSPATILYAILNYKPVSTPLPWSSFTTGYNVVISVLSLFILLVKFPMLILHVWYPLLSVLAHAALIILYGFSVHAQTAPDTIDPEHINRGAPWYITKSCSVVHTPSNYGYCQQAKASFAVTIILLALFVTNFLLAIWSSIPTRAEKLARGTVLEDGKTSPDSERGWKGDEWEMQKLPRTPGTTGGMKSPMTPRTLAFNLLGGGKNK